MLNANKFEIHLTTFYTLRILNVGGAQPSRPLAVVCPLFQISVILKNEKQKPI
jgi:hypothetical protein